MRIGFLTNNTRIDNGWGRSARELVGALRRKDIGVLVLVEEGGGLAGELKKLARAQGHPVFLFASVVRTLTTLYRCDLIHAFDGYPYAIIGAVAAACLRKKLIVTLHGTYALDPFYNRRRYIRYLYRWALKRADRIVTVSRYTRRTVEAEAGFALLGAVVIPNGTSAFWLAAPQSVVVPPVPKPYILGVGMVKPQKGYAVSMHAYAQIKKRFPALSYVIVGDQAGRHFQEMRDLARQLGVADSVRFFEKISDEALLSFYDHAACFVLTPVRNRMYIEGFGLVYREAGARGLAVVGSRDSGAEDAIIDGKTGILCPQNGIGAVADAVMTILGDPDLAGRMGREGKKVAAQDTWARVAAAYYALYQETLTRYDHA